MGKVHINGEGWATIGASTLGGTVTTALGAGTLREAAVIVPAMWLVVFVLTGGRPTRVMTSDMLDGLEDDGSREAHDLRAKRYGWVIGLVLVIGLGYWIWTSPTPYD